MGDVEEVLRLAVWSAGCSSVPLVLYGTSYGDHGRL
jgi:hypothetical protein